MKVPSWSYLHLKMDASRSRDLIHATESSHVFTPELGPHKKHDIMPSAIVWDTLLHRESKLGGTGPGQRREA